MTPKEQYQIERRVTLALNELIDKVGYSLADMYFDMAGLNTDRTWQGKDSEAWEVTLHYTNGRGECLDY